MGRWGDGEMGSRGERFLLCFVPQPNLLLLHHFRCVSLLLIKKNQLSHRNRQLFSPTPYSLLPTPYLR